MTFKCSSISCIQILLARFRKLVHNLIERKKQSRNSFDLFGNLLELWSFLNLFLVKVFRLIFFELWSVFLTFVQIFFDDFTDLILHRTHWQSKLLFLQLHLVLLVLSKVKNITILYVWWRRRSYEFSCSYLLVIILFLTVILDPILHLQGLSTEHKILVAVHLQLLLLLLAFFFLSSIASLFKQFASSSIFWSPSIYFWASAIFFYHEFDRIEDWYPA